METNYISCLILLGFYSPNLASLWKRWKQLQKSYSRIFLNMWKKNEFRWE